MGYHNNVHAYEMTLQYKCNWLIQVGTMTTVRTISLVLSSCSTTMPFQMDNMCRVYTPLYIVQYHCSNVELYQNCTMANIDLSNNNNNNIHNNNITHAFTQSVYHTHPETHAHGYIHWTNTITFTGTITFALY